jgi:hypothetical protein
MKIGLGDLPEALKVGNGGWERSEELAMLW